MAFLKALLRMKRDQQRENFQSRLASRRSSGVIAVQPQICPAPFMNDNDDNGLHSTTSLSRTKHYKPPVATPQILNGFPKQFILAPPETPTSSDFDSDDEEFRFTEEDVYNPSRGKFPASANKSARRHIAERSDRFDREYFAFSDLDYEMPKQVREILHEEGFEPSTVESWLHKAEICHRQAMAMRQFQMTKHLKASKKNVTLPPIKSTDASSQPIGGQFDKDSHQPRSSSPAPNDPHGHTLPDIIPVSQREENENGDEVCEDMKRILTEAEEVKWRCEQQLERMAAPSYDYVPPRLVLISSRIAWCHSIAKAVRKDGSKVLCLVYDFEHWTFQDLLDGARQLLDSDNKGCKARSVLFLCKGGQGYFYLLRNFVMTPQKMSRPRYKIAREFWQSVGNMISKLEPENAKIHLIGSDLQSSRQGQKLIRAIWKTVHPNRLELLSPLEDSQNGQKCLELYFDYRKFMLWRSRPYSGFSLQEEDDLTRSWSSIEEEAARKEKGHDDS